MKNKRNITWLLFIVFAFAVLNCNNGSSEIGSTVLTEARAREIIEPFYDLFRSSKWEGVSGVRDFNEGFKNHSEGWLSYDGNPSPYGTAEPRNKAETQGFLGGYMFLQIPDLNVNIITVQVDGDWVFVRSELTGTFASSNYLGLEVGDKPFNIMALDYHHIDRNGKMVELYHSENWGQAVLQSK